MVCLFAKLSEDVDFNVCDAVKFDVAGELRKHGGRCIECRKLYSDLTFLSRVLV